ncbi:MAG: hypothetical protein ACXU9W_11015, partial [Thermodesulfobacteriota bacterium]
LLGTITGTVFNDTTAVPKKTYYYWVKATNTYGTSRFSTSNAGVRSDGSPPPPTNVLASDGTYLDRVEVTWAASPNAASYAVYRSYRITPGPPRLYLERLRVLSLMIPQRSRRKLIITG